jgi:CRP-like cAMP-binding protein
MCAKVSQIATRLSNSRWAMRAHEPRTVAVIKGAKPLNAASAIALPRGFRSSFLEGLIPSEIEAVLAAAARRSISAKQIIYHEGDPAAHLFLLVTGRAARYKLTHGGAKLFLRWLAPGDVFGFMALRTDPPPLLTTVQVVREGYVLVWDRASARALVRRDPRLFANIYSAMTNYLASLIDVLVGRASQTAQQRLARMLVESAHQIGRPRRDGIECDLTNEQLAEMANVSAFTVSRQLSEWQKQGLVAKSRGKILLRSPEHLVLSHF